MEQAISDIKDKEAIEDDAAEAVKEYIGKMYISDTLSSRAQLDNIIKELPEGAEDKAVVTGPEVQTNKNYLLRRTLLDQAGKRCQRTSFSSDGCSKFKPSRIS